MWISAGRPVEMRERRENWFLGEDSNLLPSLCLQTAWFITVLICRAAGKALLLACSQPCPSDTSPWPASFASGNPGIQNCCVQEKAPGQEQLGRVWKMPRGAGGCREGTELAFSDRAIQRVPCILHRPPLPAACAGMESECHRVPSSSHGSQPQQGSCPFPGLQRGQQPRQARGTGLGSSRSRSREEPERQSHRGPVG